MFNFYYGDKDQSKNENCLAWQIDLQHKGDNKMEESQKNGSNINHYAIWFLAGSVYAIFETRLIGLVRYQCFIYYNNYITV